MKQLKYTYSRLSSESVSNLIKSKYELPNIVSCRFYLLGLHDNYLIEGGHEKYILHIYRNDWRSTQEIQFELELLAFIETHGEFVAAPIGTKSGELSFIIDSPEGQRSAALFPYADGYELKAEITVDQSALPGRAVANVHQITDTYETKHSREILDVPYHP